MGFEVGKDRLATGDGREERAAGSEEVRTSTGLGGGGVSGRQEGADLLIPATTFAGVYLLNQALVRGGFVVATVTLRGRGWPTVAVWAADWEADGRAFLGKSGRRAVFLG